MGVEMSCFGSRDVILWVYLEMSFGSRDVILWV